MLRRSRSAASTTSTVLNGAEGMTGMAGEVMKLGLGVMPLVQQLLKNGNGRTAAKRSRSET